jgi:hypothetical protein
MAHCIVLPFPEDPSPKLRIHYDDRRVLQFPAKLSTWLEEHVAAPSAPRVILDIYIDHMKERHFVWDRAHSGELRFHKNQSGYAKMHPSYEWMMQLPKERLQYRYDYRPVSETEAELRIWGPARCGCRDICRHGLDQTLRIVTDRRRKHPRRSFMCPSCGEPDWAMSLSINGGGFHCCVIGLQLGGCELVEPMLTKSLYGCFRVVSDAEVDHA